MTNGYDPPGDARARAAMLTPMPIAQLREPRQSVPQRQRMTRRIDETLDESFPASDPPSWTASVATLAPANRRESVRVR